MKKKIEKLEVPSDDGKGNFNSGANNLQIIEAVNSLIDAYNTEQEEIATSGYVETVGTPMLESTTTSNSDEEKPYHIPNMRCKTDAFKPEEFTLEELKELREDYGRAEEYPRLTFQINILRKLSKMIQEKE